MTDSIREHPDDEPAIIGFGRMMLRELKEPESEYEGSLRRAFVDNEADFITLDSNPHGQRFLAACAAWAIDKGWLFHDYTVDEGQTLVSKFRLTKQGEDHFGL